MVPSLIPTVAINVKSRNNRRISLIVMVANHIKMRVEPSLAGSCISGTSRSAHSSPGIWLLSISVSQYIIAKTLKKK
jgi:hypothetical protein